MRVGVLTGGGDCPGLNAVIRAIFRRVDHLDLDIELIGFRDGWAGLLDGSTEPIDAETTAGILHRGGTILGTSRTNPYKSPDGEAKVLATLRRLRIDALIVIGGEDTLSVAQQLSQAGVSVIGVPKTVDNDLAGTDYTFGFQTAVQTATEAIDRLHTTAESHHRVIVVEVMGRHAGWIALHSGIAGGADAILIPEKPFDLNDVCSHLVHRRLTGRRFSIVVVAEGAAPKGGMLELASDAVDEFGHVRLGGVGALVADEIQKRTGFDTRVAILGHIQRGGSPVAFDRVLATRYGVAAVDALAHGQFGKMTALRDAEITLVDIAEAVGTTRTVDPGLYELAEVFFG
jgi:ATP-dependent phosphofructokinase / diphosphate-dependent phosphofructokinase